MSYRLQIGVPLAAEVRRVAVEQIDKAGEQLQRTDNRDEGVHEARKCFKKLRGLIRLVRPALGRVYRRENTWFRDAARRLSPARDAQSVLEAFEAVVAGVQDNGFSEIRGELLRRREQTVAEDGDFANLVTELIEALGQARQRVSEWPLATDQFELIEGGLAGTYRQARNALAGVERDASTERLHEWRKQVKYHWYHVRLIHDAWPDVMGALSGELKQLSDFLGDDHDLAVLQQLLHKDPESFAGFRTDGLLDRLIASRRAGLQKKARVLGKHIFAEKPKQLRLRFRSYWNAPYSTVCEEQNAGKQTT